MNWLNFTELNWIDCIEWNWIEFSPSWPGRSRRSRGRWARWRMSPTDILSPGSDRARCRVGSTRREASPGWSRKQRDRSHVCTPHHRSGHKNTHTHKQPHPQMRDSFLQIVIQAISHLIKSAGSKCKKKNESLQNLTPQYYHLRHHLKVHCVKILRRVSYLRRTSLKKWRRKMAAKQLILTDAFLGNDCVFISLSQGMMNVDLIFFLPPSMVR